MKHLIRDNEVNTLTIKQVNVGGELDDAMKTGLTLKSTDLSVLIQRKFICFSYLKVS